MKLNSIHVFSIVLVALAGGLAFDGCDVTSIQDAELPNVELNPRLYPGLKLSFKHQTKADQLLTGPRIRQRILNDVTMYVQIHVVSVASDGTAQVELVHHRITSDTSTEPAQFASERYDSATPETARGEAALVFQPVIGEPITLSIGSAGDIKVVSGVGDLNIPQRARFLFDQVFSDAAIESTYADLFQISSIADAVPIGHSWSITRHQPDEIGKKVLQLNLTLLKVDGSTAVIDESGQSKVEIKTGPGIPKVKLVESSIRGRWTWDLLTGTLRSLTRTEKDKFQIHTLDDVDLDSTVTRITEISRVDIKSMQNTADTIMGATKKQVDSLLKGWKRREDRLSTAKTKVFRYTQDVTMVVGYRDGKVIGVAVIDRPRADVIGISESRFRELVRLLGQEPTQRDVKRDAQGIREFYVGDTESW